MKNKTEYPVYDLSYSINNPNHLLKQFKKKLIAYNKLEIKDKDNADLLHKLGLLTKDFNLTQKGQDFLDNKTLWVDFLAQHQVFATVLNNLFKLPFPKQNEGYINDKFVETLMRETGVFKNYKDYETMARTFIIALNQSGFTRYEDAQVFQEVAGN